VEKRMPRTTMVVVLVMVGAMLLATVAGVAWAKTFTCAPGSTQQNPCEGTRKADTITGTTGEDYIIAKRGSDTVNSLAQADIVYGSKGADTIDGGADTDFLYGGAGNDTIDGGPNDDQVYGGSGDDFLLEDNFGSDVDTVYGGPGDDLIDVRDGDGLDLVCDQEGKNTIIKDSGDTVNSPDC